jgi:mRNA-degrading endonuclease RelE of RelBE toxin-antitoxin system
MTYIFDLELVETAVFSRQVGAALTDDAYRLVQLLLCARPDAGAVIPGSGGLRKLRWGLRGRGKRGGARIIYCWKPQIGRIYLLFLYAKNEHELLTHKQLRALRSALGED